MDLLAVAELLGKIENELGPRLALDELGLDQGSLTLDALAAHVLSATRGDQRPGGASLGVAAEPDVSSPTGEDLPAGFSSGGAGLAPESVQESGGWKCGPPSRGWWGCRTVAMLPAGSARWWS